MVKFITSNKINVEPKKSNNSNEIDDSISIDIKIKKQPIKIGKYSFDENTITRVSIVKLKQLGYTITKIAKILKISKMYAWKWSNYGRFQGKGFRKSKFSQEEKEYLCNTANGKITGKDEVSSRQLQKTFYSTFGKNISHTTVNTILNKGLSKPLKVINTFHLTEAHEEKRKKFSEYIIEKKIKTENLFFTDECRVVLIPKMNKQNNFIRYSEVDRKNRWEPEIQKKRENATPKFEQSIMIAGGICKFGLSNLVFCSGTQNNFSYKQFLLMMKDDMEKIKQENNLEEDLIFQQDNAACHTSRESMSSIEILFGKNTIDWPPNSPDLSPIENVWAILKEKLSKRNIKNLDDLRENILDVWIKFPVSLCEKLCSTFNDKMKYIIDYEGKRINKEILEEIKKEKKEKK